MLASSFGLSKAIDALVQQDASIEEKDSRGVRAIHQAIWDHHHSVMQLLLDKGADFTVEMDSLEPWRHSATTMQGSPLYLAAIKGNSFFVRQIIKKKGDINVRLDNGGTPLHMAAANEHTSIIELLVNHGAEANAIEGLGATATYRAAENDHGPAVQILIKHQANVNLRTKLDQTPLLRSEKMDTRARLLYCYSMRRNGRSKIILDGRPSAERWITDIIISRDCSRIGQMSIEHGINDKKLSCRITVTLNFDFCIDIINKY